jgi:asparagine synthase (glutamine-hydrolysing)
VLAGVYRPLGVSDSEIAWMRRLAESEPGAAQALVGGRLALATTPSAITATVDGIHCVLDGRLFERDRLLRDLGPGDGGDAELVARGYRRHGADLLLKLRGRFAVLIWDEERGAGLLGSDLLATRSLVLRRGPGYLAFATELRELLSLLPSRPPPDRTGVVSWLGGLNIAPDRTMYEGVSRLSPGDLFELSERMETRPYWRPKYQGTLRGSRQELAEGLRGEIERAVSRRLSARSSGVVLSGGLDSSIVTAIAAHVKQPEAGLRTYSAVFPGEDYDESWKVRSLTASLGIEPGLFRVAAQGSLWLNFHHARRWALPLLGTGSLVDVAMVDAASRDGVEVVLEGQTGDEVFGLSQWLVADRLKRGRLMSALGLLARWPGAGPTTPRQRLRALRRVGLKGAAPYRLHRLARRRKDPADVAPGWLHTALKPQFAELEDHWSWKTHSGPLWWRYLADVVTWGPHQEQRLDYLRHRALAFGIEGETPLYDFDLVDFCLRLPPELAWDPAVNRPLAREAVRGLMPDDVRLDNNKAYFSPFCVKVLTGSDAKGIDRLLTSGDAELAAYVDMPAVERLWRDQRPDPTVESAMVMWGSDIDRIVAAECWLRTQADPGALEDALGGADVPPPSAQPGGGE